MKKLYLTVLMTILVFSFSSVAMAKEKEIKDETVQAYGEYWDGYVWALDYVVNDTGISTEAWVLQYVGNPSTESGEVDTIQFSQSYSHTYSGSLSVPIREVELQLGYTFGQSTGFAISKASRPLEKGEYVKAYSRKTYSVSDIHQAEYYYVLQNGVYTTWTPTGNAKIAYGKRAIFPQLKFEYYKVNPTYSLSHIVENNALVSSEVKPNRIEIYEANENGEYVLTKLIKDK